MPTPDEWFNAQIEKFRTGGLSPQAAFDVGVAKKLTIEGWEPLQYMALPIMVFRSRTQPGSFVLLLDAKSNGEYLVAAVHYKELQGRGRFAFIQSVHHKSTQSILWWIEQGDCVLYDQKKCQAWLQNSAPSNWEQYAGQLGLSNIGNSG